MKAGIVDYESGNLKSVETALRYLGIDFITSEKPAELLAADRLVFPGVGEAAAAMKALTKRGLDSTIKEFAESGRQILGICLGSQILLRKSEERDTPCLGLIPGTVKRIPPGPGLKIPHMGWNQISHQGRHAIFKNIPEEASFYFVHSYYTELEDASLEIASTEYGIRFTTGIGYKNLTSVQFHPEKSGEFGLQLLRNFFEMEEQ